MVQEPGTPGWPVFSLDFWAVAVVFSFRGHDTDTYRTVSSGRGAFELCLPSLGFLVTKLLLRTQLLGRTLKTT